MIKLLLFLAIPISSVGQVSTALISQTFTAVASGTSVYVAGGAVTGHKLSFVPVGTVTTCTVAVDSSADGISWTAGGVIAGQTCTSAGTFATTASVTTAYIRINVTVFSGGGSVIVTYAGLGNASTLTDSDGRAIVVGDVASGAAPVGNPIGIAGFDGTNAQRVATSNAGSLNLSGGASPADGVANSSVGQWVLGAAAKGGMLMAPIYFNGATWDRAFYCNKTAFATISATTTQIVAGVASQKIRICSVVIERTDVTAVATTFKFVEGTGTNCATGQANTTGVLVASGATAPSTAEPATIMGLGATGALITATAADALCGTETGAASSMDVTITYAQY